MSIELVTQDDQACLGIRLDQSRYVFNKVRFGPGIGNRWADKFASGQVDIARQDLCTVPDVVELAAFHFVLLGWQGDPVPLKSLDPRFFVGADYVNASGLVLFLGRSVQLADLLYLLCKLIPILNVWVFPIPTSVRL